MDTFKNNDQDLFFLYKVTKIQKSNKCTKIFRFEFSVEGSELLFCRAESRHTGLPHSMSFFRQKEEIMTLDVRRPPTKFRGL